MTPQSISTMKTMSSLEVAELTGKLHKNVLRDIRNMISALESGREVGSDLSWLCKSAIYKDSQGKEQEMYLMDKDTTLTLLSGYDTVARHKIIQRWQQLEEEKSQISFWLPQTYAEALRELAATIDEKEKIEAEKLLLENKVAADAPKVDLVDSLINTDDCFTSSVIAQDHNISAISFHRKLQSAGIIRKVEGIWILTAKYAARDYGRMRTFLQTDQEGIQHARMSLVWTQRGRAFLDWFFKKTPVKSEQ